MGDATRSTAIRCAPQRAARRSTCCRGPGVYERLAAIGSRLRAGIVESGARHGFAVQAPGEDAVFGVRFTDRRPLRNWMDLTTANKDLG